jgi:hypothetical protein
MRWSVGLQAQGDRPVTHDEIVELADAVAPHGGIASGIGTDRYGAQIVVVAETREQALEQGAATFRAAAATAGLPEFPIVHAEAVSEAEDDMAWET